MYVPKLPTTRRQTTLDLLEKETTKQHQRDQQHSILSMLADIVDLKKAQFVGKIRNPQTLHYAITKRYDDPKTSSDTQCCHFINRKQRYCTHRAIPGNIDKKCSEHTKESLLESRNRDKSNRIRTVINELIDTVISKSSQNDNSKIGNPDNEAIPLIKSLEAVDRNVTGLGSSNIAMKTKKRVSAPHRMANPYR